jgi:hypothetical protein
MVSSEFTGRQPESLAPGEWQGIEAYLKTGKATGWMLGWRFSEDGRRRPDTRDGLLKVEHVKKDDWKAGRQVYADAPKERHGDRELAGVGAVGRAGEEAHRQEAVEGRRYTSRG